MDKINRFAFGVFLVLATALPASAGRVLVFTDSIGITGWPTQWPQLFIAQRPDLTMCENTLIGRDTAGGVTVIQSAIDACGSVTDVVVMLGVNDPLMLGETDPKETAKRLRTIANKIRARGAREWILTPVPATNDRGTGINHQQFTRDVRKWLYHMNGSGVSYNVADVRDKFTEILWSSCASDGIHPDGIACRQPIADFVAGVVP